MSSSQCRDLSLSFMTVCDDLISRSEIDKMYFMTAIKVFSSRYRIPSISFIS